MQSSHPELLLPAGDLQKLKFALAYGADAVYAGVPIFSLRARENGFTFQSLIEAIEICRAQGKRIYLTMNVFAHNAKVKRFLDTFCEMYDHAPGGFIMSDIGLIAQALKLRPQAVIHLSTQANVTNWTAVQFYRDLGLRRIILSRELSLKEISLIHNKVPDIELEAFVHGAVCIAYSGRCLISNYLNHRDANQGTCTNSCRWNYKLALEKGSLLALERSAQEEKENEYSSLAGSYYVTEPKRPEQRFAIDEDEHGTYLMNSKDLCAIELLKELNEAGVCSFKVEGRTKSVYYLAVIAKAYRKSLDDLSAGRPFNPANLREVMSTSSRTLMSGFYLKRPKEYGENREDGDSLALTHRFAGQVTSYDSTSNLAELKTKGKICLGDQVEWITPRGNVSAAVEMILNEKHESIQEISGGLSCFLSPPVLVDEFCLLRTKL